MSIVDLLDRVIVIAVIVSIVLGIVSYAALRLHRSRRTPEEEAPGGGSWYFVRYDPDSEPHLQGRR